MEVEADVHAGEETKAEALLSRMRDKLQAGEEVETEIGGPLTVRSYAKGWLEERKALGVRDIEAEDSHLRLHIFPAIGDMPLADVRRPFS